MSDLAAEVAKLIRQQAAIANFGGFALREPDLGAILNEAARVCAGALDAPFSKVCRFRAESHDLLVDAGFGWREGIVGHVTSRADHSTPQGRAFTTGEPAICPDLSRDSQFVLPAFYGEHGVRSTIDVVIKGASQAYGVLEVDCDEPRDFDPHDIDFLTSFANVLAEAVDTAARAAAQRDVIAKMQDLVGEKDRLLEQKRILADELQHRVRNNLQLVSGMLNTQLRETDDVVGQKGLRAISRRVATLAEVYEHLLGRDVARTTDFGGYVGSLCHNLAEIHADETVTLTCDCDSLALDLDAVTALGIIIAEVVANSYDHAFQGRSGATITVTVRAPTPPETLATLTVVDNGSGFDPAPASKRRGVGLVRRLADQIGGTVSVEALVGTAWTVRFPIATLD